MILPADLPVNEDLVEVGDLIRKEVDKIVVAYSFDLRNNAMATELIDNPSAGREHHFKAYRVAGDPNSPVTLQEKSRALFESSLSDDDK